MNKKLILRIILTIFLALIGFLFKISNIVSGEIFSSVFYVIAYLIIGYDILKKAIRNIFHGEIFDENFLMVVATIGALIIGEFPEAILVMLLYQIGENFQNIAVGKSRNAIRELMEIKPEFANVRRENGIVEVSPEEVNIGEIIVIKPGEKVPLDGKVISGTSMLDTKTITGESLPREINKDDVIYSGSINLSSVIEVEVAKRFEDSAVSKILELVEEATSKKTQTERFITKFAKYYTPIVCLLALFLAIIPPIVLKQEFTPWIYRALTFLVISCPCALVISVPLGFFRRNWWSV